MAVNLTTEQIENILIDSGAVYVNYGETDERLLAPCKDGNTFVVEQEIHDIEYDGSRGKTKGMRRIISENAALTVRLMDLSQDNLKLAIRGSIKNATTGAITNSGTIADSEYLKNITLVGSTLGGEWKIITLYNAMSDNGLNIETKDKEEGIMEVVFAAHYDPANLSSLLYKIEQVATLV